MRIEFTRSGGLAGLRINKMFDSATMGVEDARALENLVEFSGFFQLPEVLRSPGADQFQFKITIEDVGKTHTVLADERAVPPQMSPLVKYLMAAARPGK